LPFRENRIEQVDDSKEKKGLCPFFSWIALLLYLKSGWDGGIAKVP